LRHRRAVAGERPKASDALLDDLGQAWVVRSEPRGCPFRAGEPRQLPVVLGFRDRAPVGSQNLLVDPERDVLVVRERAVEVEEDSSGQSASLSPVSGLKMCA
jgi:hypothetical protein